MRRKMKEDVADDEEIYREERMRQEVEVEEVDDPCVAVRVVSECEGRAQRADEGRDDVAAVVGIAASVGVAVILVGILAIVRVALVVISLIIAVAAR